MKSFQNFAYNIVEEPRKAYGKPTGFDPQGEPMYTKRPGPNEPGRRAEVQKSPKTPTQVRGEIEAAKAFGDIKSGGLETRTNIPSKVTQVRQARASAAGTPDPWFSKKGGKKFSFTKQDVEKATTKLQNPMRAKGGSQAFADFIDDYSKENKISKSSALRQAVEIPDTKATFKRIFGQALRTQKRSQLQNPSQPKQLGLFGTDEPVLSKPKKPLLEPKVPSTPVSKGQLSISDIKPPEKPPGVKQPEVSQKAAAYRSSQKPPTSPRTEFGGTPKAVSFSTPTPSKTSGAQKSSVLDISAKEVPGSKVAEPPIKPKKLPGLNLGTEPAGPLVSTRPGESKTIRPQSGPGRTGVLGKPKAGQMVNAKIEPVNVSDITKQDTRRSFTDFRKKITGNVEAPAPDSRVTVNTTTDPRPMQQATKQLTKGGALVKSLKGAAKIAGPVGSAIEAGLAYKQQRAIGSGRLRSAGAGAASIGGGTLGGIVGSAVAGPVGGLIGYGLGSYGGQKAFDVAAGANAKQRALMAQINRQRQAGKAIVGTGGRTTFSSKGKDMFISTGAPGTRKTVQLAKTSVVKDPITGKSQVGYLAKQGGQAVYKRGADPSTLAKTSTNWLERVGRTIAPGAYTKHDIKQTQSKLAAAQKSDAATKAKLGIK